MLESHSPAPAPSPAGRSGRFRVIVVPTVQPHRTRGPRAVRGVHSMALSRHRAGRGGRGNGGRGTGHGEHLARVPSGWRAGRNGDERGWAGNGRIVVGARRREEKWGNCSRGRWRPGRPFPRLPGSWRAAASVRSRHPAGSASSAQS